MIDFLWSIAYESYVFFSIAIINQFVEVKVKYYFFHDSVC